MARNFNGSSDKVQSTTNLTPINFTDTSPCTFATWFKTTNNGSSALALLTTWLFQGNGGNHLELNDSVANTLAFGVLDKFATNARFVRSNAIASISDGNWHHALATYDGSQSTAGMQLYLDGSAITTNSITNTAPTMTGITTLQAAHLTNVAADEWFPGSLADCAIWNRNLTALEVLALGKGFRPRQIPNGLVHWWPFDGLASPEPDLSGGQRNGTLTGTAAIFGPPFELFTPHFRNILPATIAFTPAMRRTLSGLGTGVGTRQLQEWGQT